jgi:hypothetical protein
VKNRFYKVIAVLIAVNMMSITVFAAEEAASSESEQPAVTEEQSTGSSDQTTPASDAAPAENTTTEQSQPAETAEQTPAATGTSTDEAATGSSDAASQTASTDAAATGTSTETATTGASTEGTSATDASTDAAATGTSTETATTGASTEGTSVTNASTDAASTATTDAVTEGTSAAPTDQEIADMLEESKRRVAENNATEQTASEAAPAESEQTAPAETASSWSNDGTITDVMGIRADVDGSNVIISYKTKHTNDWDYSYQNNPITINYADGNGTGNNNTIIFDWDGYGVHGDNWSSIDGVTITKSSDQNDTEIVSISIPASWFESMDFTVSGGDYTAQINGTPIEDSTVNDAVYTGISLDGTFNDWDAVQKSTLVEPDGEHNVESVAWMIESDYVYIYIKDDGSNSATWAGPNHNGKYAITTDLGRTLVFQLTEDGAVVGADGAVSNHTGSQWEIAIPTSSLPQNNGGLSFGLYLSDTTLDGYGEGNTNQSSTDISYDGLYGDWDNYPHKEIQYATAGTHENVPDGEAAIYVDNNVYGHCETQMQAHLDEKGGEFTQAVTVLVNDDWSHALMMRLATVDGAGNINWNPDRTNLDNGSYEYYIFGVDCWGASQNINDLVEADVCYGKATITLTDGRHDMEWYLDSNKLAARYGIAENEMKTVSSQYGRIGQEWVKTAGTSSGPYAGAAMCMMSALVPFIIKKKFMFN